MRIYLSYGYRPHSTPVYFEKAFRREHDICYIGPSFRERTGYQPNEDVCALTQVLGAPDLFLFIEPGINFFPRGLESLSCPTACYLIDVHSDLAVRERYAPFFDYIFLAQKDYVEHFKRLGYPNVYWLPLGCDPNIHGEIISDRVYDIGFVGNTMGPNHPRGKLLRKISERYRTNDMERFYSKEEITTIYSRSKIVVNIPVKGDLNMRVFEAMAGGALLLTEAIGNGQGDFFTDGINIAEYRDERELFEKIDYFLQHEDGRQRIAKAGQEQVLSTHTYQVRSTMVLDAIFNNTQVVLSARVRTMTAATRHLHYARVFTMLNQVDPVITEIREATASHATTPALWLELAKCLLRAINAFIPLTSNAHRARRNAAA